MYLLIVLRNDCVTYASKRTPDERFIIIGTVRIGDDGQQIVSDTERVIKMSDIDRNTLTQEENDPKIVSFSVRGSSANYNLKFKSEKQAELFVGTKVTKFSFVQWYFLRKTTFPSSRMLRLVYEG